jgi:probable F420-dependent oxidoreductase
MAFARDLEAQRRDLAARLGRVGVWTFALDRVSAAEERAFVAELEALGFRALWIPEGLGSKEAFAHATTLLAAGRSVLVATGIASIWARDSVAMANGARLLEDAFPGRFVLGMGVSHESTVARRGHVYRAPYRRMADYLDAMERARYGGPNTEGWPPIVLAALGPRMLALAAERTAGAHPYFVPVEHTELARRTMGEGPLLLPEQAAVLETDPGRARAVARSFMEHYLDLPNYANNLLRLGWSEEDLRGGGSDRLVDAIVAWGDVDAIRARVRAHLEAGADHVSVQVLTEDPRRLPTPELRELAPALLA